MNKGPKIPLVYRRNLPDMSWHDQAACNRDNNPEANPDDFGPIGYNLGSRNPRSVERIARALKFCDECPVIALCRRQAAEDIYAEGVWGGWYWSITGHRRLANRVDRRSA